MKYLLACLVSVLLINISVFAGDYTTTSSDGSSYGYNAPVMDGSIEFKASIDNGVVKMGWSQYNGSDTFKYYKVVRSNTNSNPYYPDHSYIKAISDVTLTEYSDSKPQAGKNYYRVCAITAEKNRYCSNVVKLYYEKSSDTPIACTREYVPVCGQPKMPECPDGAACIQAMPEVKTYSNKCMLKAAGAEYLYGGKCNPDTPVSNIPKTCSKWYDGCNTCSVVNGKIDGCTEMACFRQATPKCLEYKNNPVACTMEAKLCPDGKTYVGRTGPDCEFKKCPSNPVDDSGLSNRHKFQINNLVNAFVKKIKKNYDSNEARVRIINKVITRIEQIKPKTQQKEAIISYLILKFKDAIESMDNDLSDIIDILNEY